MTFGLDLKIRQFVLGLDGSARISCRFTLSCSTAARADQLGFGFRDSQLVGRRIETQQHVAGGDDHVVPDAHVGNAAGHFARDLSDVSLDERVLGGGVAATLQPDDQRAEQDGCRHADQCPRPQPRHHGAAFPL